MAKSRKMRGGNLAPLVQEAYAPGGEVGAAEHGVAVHNEDGSLKISGGDCGCTGGVTPTPESSVLPSLYGGKSRKSKQLKIPGLLFLEKIGTPTKRKHYRRKTPKNKGGKRCKTAKK